MELINLKRILSDDTVEIIKGEISSYVDGEKYKLFLGQVHIGMPIDNDHQMIYEIIEIVCNFYKSEKSMVLSLTRRQPYMKYRQIILFLCRKYTKLNLGEIGKRIGKFDHSTVIHSIKTIQNYLRNDIDFASEIDKIEQSILLVRKDEPNY